MKVRDFVAAAVLSLTCASAVVAKQGEPPHVGISAAAVQQAIKKLGFESTEFKDKKGNPHFVLKDPGGNAKAVAIYMEDCKQGRCADVTLYADFGPVAKLKADTLNEWNHIGTKMRSKAFRSGGVENANGQVGIASTVSYMTDKDTHGFGMQLGLFLVEVKIFGATLSQL